MKYLKNKEKRIYPNAVHPVTVAAFGTLVPNSHSPAWREIPLWDVCHGYNNKKQLLILVLCRLFILNIEMSNKLPSSPQV
ncbi:hypothetical protein CEXT_119421 [Caerostris extrusa]|uniref:Uncharacterized protein n=1 Tax=Caerostris extrusa TaxID=172846 RepID=A0AAV4N8P3_CAEEX|nr:hypothetical protein CEXT_119421 [Caerostris extrusa]